MSMISPLSSSYTMSGLATGKSDPAAGAAGATSALAGASPAAASQVSISSLSSRLAAAADAAAGAYAGLSHDALGDQLRQHIAAINYPLTEANKAAMAKQTPKPADAASLASAQAANAFVDDLHGPNPFAGLSREQLSTIANDESGSFTTNERYAAYRQSYEEEQKWRSQAVAQAMDEYHRTGKLTNFFSAVLEHFQGLPPLEQALYPADYAADLQAKIDLDFNYATNTPEGASGKHLITFPDVYPNPTAAHS